MNTASLKTIESALREYSALVDSWWAGAGDTHELLSAREVLGGAASGMSQDQREVLFAADRRVQDLVLKHRSDVGWDIKMLRETAALIDRSRSLRQAA